MESIRNEYDEDCMIKRRIIRNGGKNQASLNRYRPLSGEIEISTKVVIIISFRRYSNFLSSTKTVLVGVAPPVTED